MPLRRRAVRERVHVRKRLLHRRQLRARDRVLQLPRGRGVRRRPRVRREYDLPPARRQRDRQCLRRRLRAATRLRRSDGRVRHRQRRLRHDRVRRVPVGSPLPGRSLRDPGLLRQRPMRRRRELCRLWRLRVHGRRGVFRSVVLHTDLCRQRVRSRRVRWNLRRLCSARRMRRELVLRLRVRGRDLSARWIVLHAQLCRQGVWQRWLRRIVRPLR